MRTEFVLSSCLLYINDNARQGFVDTKKPYLTYKIMDEGEVGRDRANHADPRQVAQKQMTKLWGHWGVHENIIMQEYRPPSEVAQAVTHKIEKPNLINMDYVDLKINAPGIRFNDKLYNIRDSGPRDKAGDDHFYYNSYGTQIMVIDVNPLLLSDYISSVSEDAALDQVAQYDAAEAYLKRHRGEGFNIISDEVMADLLYRQRERCKIHKDPHIKKMAAIWRLAASVDWTERKLEYAFKKIKARESEVMDKHTEDFETVEPPKIEVEAYEGAGGGE